MKIPINQNLLASIVQPRESRVGSINPDQNAEAALDFTAYLDLSLQNSAARRTEQPPLGNMRLQSLIELVELQMQRALLKAFHTTDQDELISPLAAMPLSGMDTIAAPPDASKFEQSRPQSDNKTARADFSSSIDRASRTYGVDKDLIRSVIKAESDFDPQATSSKGAMGLMQLMPDTARDLGVSNAYDPEENIMAGTRYLKSLLDRYEGDVPRALAAYNWGMGNVERYPDRLPQETREYIARITQYLRQA
ncbi:MAG: lytic transglycosylase domain-containing protein [Syntrophaceae bacterium]